MKSALFYVFLFSIIFFGCSKKENPVATNNGTGIGGLGGGGNTGNVTIQVQGQNENFQGQNVFMIYINPSVNINLQTVSDGSDNIQINSQFQAGQFQQCIFYSADAAQTGVQVAFRFQGTTLDGNQNFDVTTNYTVP